MQSCAIGNVSVDLDIFLNKLSFESECKLEDCHGSFLNSNKTRYGIK